MRPCWCGRIDLCVSLLVGRFAGRTLLPMRAEMQCFACQSPINEGDSLCTNCGAAARPSRYPESVRKFVTILRADLVQSTDLIAGLDPEEALSRLEPALAAMRAAVRQFRGIVSKEL